MKTILLSISMLFILLSIKAQLPQLLPGETWVQLYADEFNELNSSNWIIDNEFDHYGNIWVAIDNNVYIENGNLVLKADDKTYNCTTPVSEWSHRNSTYNYTSAFLTTNNTLIHYGYIEARIKCPYFNSVNSAFWTFKADQFNGNYSGDNEIDIFENLAETGYNKATTNIHTGDGIDYYNEESVSDYRNYHIYGCEWTPTQITFYIDGVLKRTIANPGVFDPVVVIFDIGFGAPSNAIFPYYMYVDYLRIWGRERTIENRTLNSGKTSDFASYAFNIAGNGGSYSVNTGAINELYATKSITLKPGFTAFNGSGFIARIDNYTKISETKSSKEFEGFEKGAPIKAPSLITQENKTIKIWPNPAKSTLKVICSEIPDNIQIFTLSGQKVLDIASKSPTTSIDVSKLLGGVYIVKVRINSNLYTGKLIINH
jgi:hypothetical protein